MKYKSGFPTGFWHSAQYLDCGFLKLLQNLTEHPAV